MRTFRARVLFYFAMLCFALAATHAAAGVLTRADLERYFPPPYILGEKDDALPVWPIFKQNATENQLVAYAYESIDLAPIPGFSGTPIDLHGTIVASLLGAVFAFLAGLVALKWLSSWLENGRWYLFGIYCLVASAGVFWLHTRGY